MKAESQTADTNSTANILVVDDETTIFDVFHMMLPAPRYALSTAARADEALQLAGKQIFDVAFVDYFLGEASGPEVAQKLRKLQPELKIILMSGYLRDERSAAMETAGASAFLTKPFSLDVAQALVNRLLTNRPPREKPRPAEEGVQA